MLRTCTAIGAAVLTVATVLASPAGAAGTQADMVHAQQIDSQTGTVPAVADPCGNHIHVIAGVAYRYWRNCITKSEKINIDTVFAPDKKMCVGAGSDTILGSVDSVRGASRVGDC